MFAGGRTRLGDFFQNPNQLGLRVLTDLSMIIHKNNQITAGTDLAMSEFAMFNDSLKESTMATRKFRTSPRRYQRCATPRRHTTRSCKQGGRPWSREEIAFMRKYYRNNETTWCARQLGRTVYSVRYKASSLSIKKTNPSNWRGNKGTTYPRPTASRYNRTQKPRWTARTTYRTTRRSKSRRYTRSGR